MSGPGSSLFLLHMLNAQCSGTTETDLHTQQGFFPSSHLARGWEALLGLILCTPLWEVIPYIADVKAPMCPESLIRLDYE